MPKRRALQQPQANSRMSDDARWLAAAASLAARARPCSRPNPAVGAIVVSQGRVVGQLDVVKDGPLKGVRLLPAADDLARELFQKLDDKQRPLAYRQEHFPEVEGKTATAPVKEPVGLPAAQMTPAQRESLLNLIKSYLERLPADVAQSELKEIQDAGFDKIYFARSGDAEPGKPHSYRVQGPTFLIHYMCDQTDPVMNPGNHIHSVYRNLRHDFGEVRN